MKTAINLRTTWRPVWIACSLSFFLYCHPAFAGYRTITNDTLKQSCLTQASKQLDEAFVLMQRHYYKKETVQWDSLIVAARERLKRSSSCEEALQTVNWCFKQISEAHSFLMAPDKAAVYNNTTATLAAPSMYQMVGTIRSEMIYGKGIAYLTLPWINTTDQQICTAIADSLQHLIAAYDAQGVSKWIIDLRENTGGNCWPMLAGIGPLLGNGVCGYFVSAREKVPISYLDGAAKQGRSTRCQVSGTGYTLKNNNNKVVVLTGPRTSSSGEIVAMAFKGKSQTMLYGEPTAGFTTANTTYTLSDNTMLVLTICQEADRNGKLVEGKIIPDVLVPSGGTNSVDDEAKSAAIMWLHIQ